MMEFLVRFSQAHESFRLPELQALADLEGIDMKVIEYSLDSPFCIITLPSPSHALRLVARSLLTQSIHLLLASAPTHDEIHPILKFQLASDSPSFDWSAVSTSTFKFSLDTYQSSRPHASFVSLINAYKYLPLHGAIDLKTPDLHLTIFEDWDLRGTEGPKRVHLARFLATGARSLSLKYDLKKRGYISTTSMDSELALVTANLAHAAPGKLFYDPFVGTGSFPVACAHFGALGFGSDIDGRAIRGSGGEKSVKGNFAQYGLSERMGEFWTADLTNSPVRRVRWLDGIVCDPPYGVREGLRVLGCRDPEKTPWVVEAGKQRYKSGDFIAPKKPYSFLAMLDDILEFASETLVDGGRLSFWMPTANDEDQEIPTPQHPRLDIVATCVQPFNKWSRRLITYRRIPDSQVDPERLAAYKRTFVAGTTADELNPFRRGYFTKFEKEEA
ncbi:S-adenosyl-L-methionine-dependent methyltransferase [Colletotrichum phormii]|uniref:tRNA (guanine(10)-N(2))-methyltransferase n=1 Tax=Colletotrichum phormii TaxID=359342 RepID=A0AAJ0EAR6_9PEZI|nr:S-adenosyl-L-methionine-dependent methyltransferase [Colletotrichum phormii]KAK1625394.1 S-adenosyl-L-methionine-dependent methyltransferase [Colletotrichum phormii]